MPWVMILGRLLPSMSADGSALEVRCAAGSLEARTEVAASTLGKAAAAEAQAVTVSPATQGERPAGVVARQRRVGLSFLAVLGPRVADATAAKECMYRRWSVRPGVPDAAPSRARRDHEDESGQKPGRSRVGAIEDHHLAMHALVDVLHVHSEGQVLCVPPEASAL